MDIVTYALAKKQAVKEVPGLVDDWLSENVDPSTGYVLDNTLSLDNAAPPASAVGDLKTAVNNPVIITQSEIEQGEWNGMNKKSNTKRIRTSVPIRCYKGTKVKSVGTGLLFNAAVFPERYSAISAVTEASSYNYTEYTITHDGWLVFVFKNSGGTAITPSNYTDYYIEIDTSTVRGTSNVIVNETANILPNLKGKTVAFLGDSITAGSGYTKSYFMNLAERFGLICKNYGYGGSGYGYSDETNSGYYGTGKEGKGDSMSSTKKITPNDFLSRIASIPNDVDAIVIFGGTNDWNIGGYTVEQFRAYVDAVFDYAQTNIANMPIFVISPLKRLNEMSNGAYVQNAGGAYLYEFVDAIKDECGKYGIQFIDAYHQSGINPHKSGTNTYFFVRSDSGSNDGLHVNNKAHERIAALLANPLSIALSDWGY